MTLTDATGPIRQCLQKMAERFGATVFDEWAMVTLAAGRSTVIDYSGPRPEEFRQNFAQDIKPLRSEIVRGDHRPGDFEFVHDAVGTNFDAFLLAGPGCYLLFNNTVKTMAEIRANPQWIRAQRPFVTLSEAFYADPLVIDDN